MSKKNTFFLYVGLFGGLIFIGFIDRLSIVAALLGIVLGFLIARTFSRKPKIEPSNSESVIREGDLELSKILKKI
jgi:positive regulator of sigma E activity